MPHELQIGNNILLAATDKRHQIRDSDWSHVDQDNPAMGRSFRGDIWAIFRFSLRRPGC